MITIKQLFTLFTFSLMLVFSGGCILSDDNKSSRESALFDYFPLQAGNKWTYSYQSVGKEYQEEFSIIQKTTIGYSRYYVFNYNKSFWQFFFHNRNILGKNEKGDLTVGCGTIGKVLYAFSDTTIRNNITSFHNEVALLLNTHDTVVTPAGIFVNCYNFSHFSTKYTDSNVEFWFAPSIGPVRIMQCARGLDLVLTSAVVNGKKITEELPVP